MKTKAWFWTPHLLLRLHCHISDRQNPEARVVRPMSIGPHSSAEAWNQQWSIQSQSTRRFYGHTQQERFTVTLNHKVLTVNTKYWQSTQCIDRQHNVFTVSAKGIRQPVKPASGVSQYYVTMTSATYHWQSTSNLSNSRQKWEVIVPKIGQACALRKGVFLFSVLHFFVIWDQKEP